MSPNDQHKEAEVQDSGWAAIARALAQQDEFWAGVNARERSSDLFRHMGESSALASPSAASFAPLQIFNGGSRC